MAAKAQRQPITKHTPPSYLGNVADKAQEEKAAKTTNAPRERTRRRRVVREQVSTRLLGEIRDAADDYMADTGTTFQSLVESALTDYLEKKGYDVG